jgi:hypothetical protein
MIKKKKEQGTTKLGDTRHKRKPMSANENKQEVKNTPPINSLTTALAAAELDVDGADGATPDHAMFASEDDKVSGVPSSLSRSEQSSGNGARLQMDANYKAGIAGGGGGSSSMKGGGGETVHSKSSKSDEGFGATMVRLSNYTGGIPHLAVSKPSLLMVVGKIVDDKPLYPQLCNHLKIRFSGDEKEELVLVNHLPGKILPLRRNTCSPDDEGRLFSFNDLTPMSYHRTGNPSKGEDYVLYTRRYLSPFFFTACFHVTC